MKLDGKIAVVTGAKHGIGRCIALTFADAGADVVVCDLQIADVEEVAGEIEAKGRKGLAVKADVTQESDVNQMIQKTVEKFGRVDILVNNAAYTALLLKEFHETDVTYWDKHINVTFKGTLYCCKSVIPHMIAQGSGKIINIASGAASRYSPRLSIYAACKAAVVSFSRSLAAELGPYGIHVNCVAPNAVRTPILETIPIEMRKERLPSVCLRREGEPEDIANLVLFLASEMANYITGQQYHVDGGNLMKP